MNCPDLLVSQGAIGRTVLDREGQAPLPRRNLVTPIDIEEANRLYQGAPSASDDRFHLRRRHPLWNDHRHIPEDRRIPGERCVGWSRPTIPLHQVEVDLGGHRTSGEIVPPDDLGMDLPDPAGQLFPQEDLGLATRMEVRK